MFVLGATSVSVLVAAFMFRETSRDSDRTNAASPLEPLAQASGLPPTDLPVRELLEQDPDLVGETRSLPTDTPIKTYSVVRDGQGWNSIYSLLSDPQFLEASTSPGDHDSQLLESLVERARTAIDPVVASEVDARFAAGISKILAGYVPGEPLSTKTRDSSLITSYVIADGIAHQVDLPRNDYQDLYAASDGRLRMQTELNRRRREAAALEGKEK